MANNLQNWSPFRELDHFKRSLDEMFDHFLGNWNPMEAMRGMSTPAFESYIDNNQLVVRADLPGIDPKDVEVTVNADVLTVRGKRQRIEEEKKRDYIHREVSYGSFERSMTLPKGVNADQIKASYKNGVLELTMPAPQELAPRKVPIAVEGRTEPNGGAEKKGKSQQ